MKVCLTPPALATRHLGLLAWLLFLLPLSAQTELLSTVGLAHKDASGRDWAYVVWQSPEAAATAGRSFAIYAKAGPANSTNEYQRQAIVARQQDTRVIDPLLRRSVNLGDNLAFLEADIDKLFGEVIPAGTLGPAAKLSAVLRGTTGNDRAYRNLTLLSRIHSGVSLCLGTAHAELFPPGVSLMTYEVRQWDSARRTDLAVIGRVTIDATVRLVLPPPGAPVEVPDDTGSGNLNIKLRWPMTDHLRRLGMAMHGFNLWRVTKGYAESRGFHLTPPTLADLLSSPANFRQRLNTSPVLASKYFSVANVADFSTNGDAQTFFYTDDNKYFLPGNTAFADGEAFYYFVTARDLLGRDGQPSAGLLARACDRIPPQAPRQLRATSIHLYPNGAPTEAVKLTWLPPAGGPGFGLAYYVYRYESREEMQKNGALVWSNRIAGPLTFAPGTSPLSYIDQPCTNSSSNTFWYTVRAAETTACGTNLSQPSGAAWGGCRDWHGPSGATGQVFTVCFRPEVICSGVTTINDPAPQPNKCHFRLICNSTSKLIEWAEFYKQGDTNPLVRIYFNKATNVVQDLYLPSGQNYSFYCRVGTASGAEDVGGPCGAQDCGPGVINLVRFDARVIRSVIVGEPDSTEGCFSFYKDLPYPPGGSAAATNTGPSLTLNLPPGTREYRVYRSVDGGPKGLVNQGTNATSVVSFTDTALPANSCTLCYYVQPLDEHGNPGPLSRIEPCLPVAGELPAPQLSPIQGLPLTLFGSTLTLSWFCPSPGLDHFEVWISGAEGVTSPDLTPVPQIVPPVMGARLAVAPASTTNSVEYAIFRTPRVGAAFGSNDTFSVRVVSVSGYAHKVMIRPVDIHGNTGPFSNEEEYRSSLRRISLLPQVAWPARELPLPGANNYSPVVKPFDVTTPCFDGVGIAIGNITPELGGGCTNGSMIADTTTIATDPTGASLFPVVLYRQQVANVFYPNVSGDVVQVSPLIESVAFDIPPSGNISHLVDPFFFVWDADPGKKQELLLKDTQPVVVGARYRYAFVRFKENHEIDRIIPLGEVEVAP